MTQATLTRRIASASSNNSPSNSKPIEGSSSISSRRCPCWTKPALPPNAAICKRAMAITRAGLRDFADTATAQDFAELADRLQRDLAYVDQARRQNLDPTSIAASRNSSTATPSSSTSSTRPGCRQPRRPRGSQVLPQPRAPTGGRRPGPRHARRPLRRTERPAIALLDFGVYGEMWPIPAGPTATSS